jgi:hypothetical protein
MNQATTILSCSEDLWFAKNMALCKLVREQFCAWLNRSAFEFSSLDWQTSVESNPGFLEGAKLMRMAHVF